MDDLFWITISSTIAIVISIILSVYLLIPSEDMHNFCQKEGFSKATKYKFAEGCYESVWKYYTIWCDNEPQKAREWYYKGELEKTNETC